MDILAQHGEEGYLTASQIAGYVEGRTAVREEAAPPLDRILRVLASHGLLEVGRSSSSEKSPTLIGYGLTASSRLLLQEKEGPSMHCPQNFAPNIVANVYVLNLQRVEHKAGDMFVAVPKGEAIFMKWILHNWSDNHCRELLKNCYDALPNNGKVIGLEAILSEQVEQDANSRATYHMDLAMLAFAEGGKERTKEEFEALSMSAGFSKLRVIHNIHGLSLVEILKS